MKEILHQIILTIDWTQVLTALISIALTAVGVKYGNESIQYKKFKHLITIGKPVAEALMKTALTDKHKKVQKHLTK